MPSLYSITNHNPGKNARAPKYPFLRKILKYGLYALAIFLFFYPEYLKRPIYPYLFGKKTDIKLEISPDGYYKDVNISDFRFVRDGKEYILSPKTQYSVTARVAYVDRYDTIFNKFYRGHSQGDYINIVPQDLTLVYNELARPEVISLFEFDHEERMAKLRCKGVKRKVSSLEEAVKMKKKNDLCSKYFKMEHLNNYHPIPANERINKAMQMLRPGDIIYIEGILVDVPGLGLKTGTRRAQHHKYLVSGRPPGMCFILYTTKIILNNRVYQ